MSLSLIDTEWKHYTAICHRIPVRLVPALEVLIDVLHLQVSATALHFNEHTAPLT